MSTETAIDTTEYTTRASAWEQLIWLNNELTSMEEDSEALLASDDPDDYGKFYDLADDMNDMHDQVCALQRHYNSLPVELNHEQQITVFGYS